MRMLRMKRQVKRVLNRNSTHAVHGNIKALRKACEQGKPAAIGAAIRQLARSVESAATAQKPEWLRWARREVSKLLQAELAGKNRANVVAQLEDAHLVIDSQVQQLGEQMREAYANQRKKVRGGGAAAQFVDRTEATNPPVPLANSTGDVLQALERNPRTPRHASRYSRTAPLREKAEARSVAQTRGRRRVDTTQRSVRPNARGGQRATARTRTLQPRGLAGAFRFLHLLTNWKRLFRRSPETRLSNHGRAIAEARNEAEHGPTPQSRTAALALLDALVEEIAALGYTVEHAIRAAMNGSEPTGAMAVEGG